MDTPRTTQLHWLCRGWKYGGEEASRFPVSVILGSWKSGTLTRCPKTADSTDWDCCLQHSSQLRLERNHGKQTEVSLLGRHLNDEAHQNHQNVWWIPGYISLLLAAGVASSELQNLLLRLACGVAWRASCGQKSRSLPSKPQARTKGPGVLTWIQITIKVREKCGDVLTFPNSFGTKTKSARQSWRALEDPPCCSEELLDWRIIMNTSSDLLKKNTKSLNYITHESERRHVRKCQW